MITAGNHQNVIAFIWDFDKTLIPAYCETPIFNHYKINEIDFWKEVNCLPDEYRKNGIYNITKDTLYLNHLLTFVQKGICKNLSNKLLRKLGAQITFYKGIPELFNEINSQVVNNPTYQKYDIVVEHYIVSTGIRELILGSKIAPFIDGIWASEFIEDPPLPYFNTKKQNHSKASKVIQQIGYSLDNTSKTRVLFEINKGSNKIQGLDVNSVIDDAHRRVPFENMVYIADGPSDIPMFSVMNHYGGRTCAVYKPGIEKEFSQAYTLFKEKRVQMFSEANYEKGSLTYLMFMQTVHEIAQQIVEKRKVKPAELSLSRLPEHL